MSKRDQVRYRTGSIPTASIGKMVAKSSENRPKLVVEAKAMSVMKRNAGGDKVEGVVVV